MRGEWIRKSSNGITVVFVHGILSSGEMCWRHENGAYWPELLKDEQGFQSLGVKSRKIIYPLVKQFWLFLMPIF